MNKSLVTSSEPSHKQKIQNYSLKVIDDIKTTLGDDISFNVTEKIPNIMILLKAILFSIIFILVIYIYLIITKKKTFSTEQLNEALKLNSEQFSIEEMARANLEINSLKSYEQYFSSAPYSMESQGIQDIARGVVFLPIIAFASVYILPPLILSYIGWIVIKYWAIVFNALWEWFLMMYHYGTDLIEGKLAEKWYIRMVTGWHKRYPVFELYFSQWFKQYVEVPAYYEKMKYVQSYIDKKEKIFLPFKTKYIDTPWSKIKSLFNILTTYVVDVLKVIYDFYQDIRNEFYKYLLEFNEKLGKYAKITFGIIITTLLGGITVYISKEGLIK